MSWTVDGLEFTKRKKVSVTTRPASTLTGFPLYIPIVSDYQIGAVCLPTGNDLRFTTDAGTLLYAEKDGTHGVTGGAYSGLWHVGQCVIASSADTDFWCYYGNAGASAQTGSANVWNSDYRARWSLQDPTNPLDSTSNGNHATNFGTTAATGKIAGGANFNGVSQYIRGPAINVGTDGFTLQCWRSVAMAGVLLCDRKGNSPVSAQFNWLPLGTSPTCLFVQSTLARSFQSAPSGWGAVACTWAANVARFFVNGVQDPAGGKTLATTPIYDAAAPVLFGVQNLADKNSYYQGVMDEVRISSIPRSPDWLNFEYRNQADAGNCLTWGAEESAAGGVVSPILRTAILHSRIVGSSIVQGMI